MFTFKLMLLIILLVIIAIGLTPLILYGIVSRFFHIKFLERIFCEFGWHSHQYDDIHTKDYDPLNFSVFAKCQWCGYEGQVDSQGNLF